MNERKRQMIVAAYQGTAAEALSADQSAGVAAAVTCSGLMHNMAQVPPRAGERRRLHRHPGTGLAAFIGGKLTEVLDISLGGIRLASRGKFGGGELRFQLVRLYADGRKTWASVTAVPISAGKSDIHMRFVGMNYPLAQLIIEHVANVSGVSPYIFR